MNIYCHGLCTISSYQFVRHDMRLNMLEPFCISLLSCMQCIMYTMFKQIKFYLLTYLLTNFIQIRSVDLRERATNIHLASPTFAFIILVASIPRPGNMLTVFPSLASKYPNPE